MTVDHIAIARARLPQQFRNKPKLDVLLSAIGKQCNEVEAAFQQLLTGRTVDNAIGMQLDALGYIVGQPRNGLLDDVYRRYIRARIKTNRSNGTVEDLIRIARLVIADDDMRAIMDLQGMAAYAMRVADVLVSDDLADTLIAFLRNGTSAGVRAILESSPIALDDALITLDSSLDAQALSDDALHAKIDFAKFALNVDTVLRAKNAGTAGNLIVITIGPGSVESFQDLPNSILYEFVDGVTTVSDLEAAFAGSTQVEVLTPGTGTNVLVSDDETQEFLAGGANAVLRGSLLDARD